MKTAFTFLLVAMTCNLMAQPFIDNKTDVSISYGTGKGLGNSLTTHADYTAPSLLNNFQNGTSIGLSLSHKMRRLLWSRLEISKTKFVDWNFSGNDRYNQANLSVTALNAQAGISTPFRQNGFWNLVTISAFAGPSLSLNTLKMKEAIYSQVNTQNADLMKSKLVCPGLSALLITKMHVGQSVFAGLSYSLDYSKPSSVLFDDRKFLLGTLRVQVGLKLQQNKLYKFRPQWFD